MEASITTLVGKVRKALDDIAPNVADTFVSDINAEIAQALEHAATSLSRELPLELLEPTVITNTTSSPSWSKDVRAADGSGYIVLPTDFLRFASLKMVQWKGTVSELITPGSEAEKYQRSKWSRGSNEKPKAMIDTASITEAEGNTSTTASKQVLRYWPGSSDNELEALVYVPMVSKNNDTLKCALKAECEKNLIYLTCRIILEGKKEHTAAEKFAQLATL